MVIEPAMQTLNTLVARIKDMSQPEQEQLLALLTATPECIDPELGRIVTQLDFENDADEIKDNLVQLAFAAIDTGVMPEVVVNGAMPLFNMLCSYARRKRQEKGGMGYLMQAV